MAATEDTVREVLSLPPASLDSELLVEAAVQEAFTSAAVRHFPGRGAAGRPVGRRPVRWVLGDGTARRPSALPVQDLDRRAPTLPTRPEARAVVMSEGETRRTGSGPGSRAWPVEVEAHFYELLPGGEIGHLAAFETDGAEDSFAEAALEFEQLSPSRPLPFAHPRTPTGRGGPPGRRHRPAGTRFVRLAVRGRRLRRRRRLSLRVDLSAAQPQLRLHLHLGEKVSHELVTHLGKSDMTQVVGVLRRFVGEPARAALAERLRGHLGKHGTALTEDTARALANAVAEAVPRVVANTLPSSAQELAGAARDPKPGVTLTFTFAFADKKALEGPGVPEPTLTIRPGVHRRRDPSAPGGALPRSRVSRQTINEITHWRLAAEALADLDDLAPAAAWAGLEAYLRLQVRERLAGVVSSVVQEAVALQRLAGSGAREDDLRGGLLALRSRYLRGRDRPRLLRRRRDARTNPAPGALLRGLRHARRRLDDCHARPLGIQAPPALVYVDKGLGASILRAGDPAVGPGAPVAGGGDQAHPAQPAITRRRCCTRPGTRWAHQTGWIAELADRDCTSCCRARSPDGRRHVAVLRLARSPPTCMPSSSPAGRRCTPWPTWSTAPPRTVFRLPLGDPHPFAWIRVMFNVALCGRWFGAGPWDDCGSAWTERHDPAAAGSLVEHLARPPAWRRCRDIVQLCTRTPFARLRGAAALRRAGSAAGLAGGARRPGRAGRRVAAHLVIPAPAAARCAPRAAHHPRRAGPRRCRRAPRRLRSWSGDARRRRRCSLLPTTRAA